MRIFIGSSNETIRIANSAKMMLQSLGHSAKTWKEIGMFIASTYTIDNLERICNDFDAAVFICAEDDKLIRRGKNFSTTRDNVVFESGIFTGKLGHEKVALYVNGNPELPSDWKGLTVIKASDNPDVDTEHFNNWASKILRNFNLKDNVTMLPRQLIDNRPVIEERWKYAKEITFINYASTAFIAAQKVVPSHVAKGSLRELFQQKLKTGCNFKFLITEPDSYADFDASKTKMNTITNNNIDISDLIRIASIELEQENYELQNSMTYKGSLEYRLTNIALPYGLILVTNDEEHTNLNHIKVDLYSPFLQNDSERRSFIIYQDNSNYEFFYKQITSIWNNAKKPQIKQRFSPQKISNEEIEKAITTIYRQYFVGDLQKEQLLPHIYDSKIEIGTSLYDRFTVDEPHYHRFATEYLYVLQGEYKLCIKEKNKLVYESLKAGDFFSIPKNTPYASKASKGTRVLFIKVPGINDKIVCRKEVFGDFVLSWE